MDAINMKWLLVMHFPKPEEELRKTMVKGTEVAELLTVFLRHSEPAKWRDLDAMKSLKTLFSWANSDESVSQYDLLETVRKATVEVLQAKCFLTTYQFTSRDNDEVFCKLTCDEPVLRELAHRTHYPLRLSAETEDNLEFRALLPHAPFDKNYAQDEIFATYDGSLFRDVDKIRLIKVLVDDHLNIGKMKEKGLILDLFPIHEDSQLEDISKAILGGSPPTGSLREYFGEKMAFYFMWLQKYNVWLIILAFFGILLWLAEKLYKTEQNLATMCFYDWVELSFAVIVGLWTPMFNSSWQRMANYHSVKWGTLNFSEEETPRPEFKGILRPSKVSPGLELYFSPKERRYRQVVSYCTTFFMVGLVIVLVTGIFIYKAILIQSGNHQLGATLCAIVNNVQIIVMNIVYDKLALRLNDWENHQTQSDYENALIVKKVGYQFVNYYISLFYIAFMKEHFEGCINGDCMSELRSSLWVFYVINVVFNFIELGLPIFSQKKAIKAEDEKAKKMKEEGKIQRVDMTPTERQGKLESIVLMNEYLEVVMNHGYIVFFCVAFPLGPLIYWIYNVLELKADAYKFLKLSKRPFPEMASGIGVWADIMNVLAIVGVITNTGLMIFTENIFSLSLSARWSVFIVMEHVLIMIVALYLRFSPKFGETVQTARKRHRYLLRLKYYKSVRQDGPVQFADMPPLVEDVVHAEEN